MSKGPYGVELAEKYLLTAKVEFDNESILKPIDSFLYTGIEPKGTVKGKITQSFEYGFNNDGTGHLGLSTAAYYPLSTMAGQVYSYHKKWYPFHFARLCLYYNSSFKN